MRYMGLLVLFAVSIALCPDKVIGKLPGDFIEIRDEIPDTEMYVDATDKCLWVRCHMDAGGTKGKSYAVGGWVWTGSAQNPPEGTNNQMYLIVPEQGYWWYTPNPYDGSIFSPFLYYKLDPDAPYWENVVPDLWNGNGSVKVRVALCIGEDAVATDDCVVYPPDFNPMMQQDRLRSRFR